MDLIKAGGFVGPCDHKDHLFGIVDDSPGQTDALLAGLGMCGHNTVFRGIP